MSPPFATRRERIDRIRARAWALQILYRWEATGRETSLRDTLVDTTATQRISPSRLPYVREVLGQVEAHLGEVDDLLEGALQNWRMERLAVLDRSLLRLGATEILYMPDIPPKVSIQEAVRLAEQYGGPESPRFVNGVLDALYRRSSGSAGA
ncbi:MAG: transcription antitermination factor NusB [Gemmatimonadales bacterium]|nr:MAG: transcription antitermination factor NusB [Gemmatimonadales bacterium]